jgi:hypothetical protein
VSSKHEKRNWMKMWVQIPSEPLIPQKLSGEQRSVKT